MMKISRHQQILNQLAAIRQAHSQMANIFLYGSCVNLFCILKAIHPDAEAWFNLDHVVIRIDGRFYDITGQVNVKGKGFQPFTAWFNKRRTSRSFTQMYKGEFVLTPAQQLG